MTDASIEPIVDHIQITVRDLDAAQAFYDRFLPLLGFDVSQKTAATIEDHDFRVVEYPHPRLAFAITSPRSGFRTEEVHRRRPGAWPSEPIRGKRWIDSITSSRPSEPRS